MMKRCFYVAACVLAVRMVAGATSGAGPWDAALQFDYAAASRGFAELHAAKPEDARIMVAQASVLLVTQPRTEANIRKAHEALSVVAALANAEAKEDVLLARYLLARVEQDHLSPAKPESARARYKLLLKEQPDHAFAGLAAVQLALMEAAGATPENAAETARRIETWLAGTTRDEAARELHYILGRLHWELRKDAKTALRHLVAGRALGYEKAFRNAEVDLTIGNLARLQGDRETALAHYRSFLAENRRDVRSGTVRRFVSELEQSR